MKLPGKRVWLVIAAIVIGHNLSARDGDTLSEAVDDWIAAHPVLTRAVIAVVALHLANAVSSRVDPVHLVFVGARSFPRRRIAVAII